MNAQHVTSDDETFLRRAIALAQHARDTGDDPFGSLLVDGSGAVLAEEHNTVRTDRDIRAHPELKLAKWAARELDAPAAAGSTLYTSCQPCQMCTGALARSGIGRVVFALSNAQLAQIAPSDRFDEVPQEGPALFDEASRAVAGYYE